MNDDEYFHSRHYVAPPIGANPQDAPVEPVAEYESRQQRRLRERQEEKAQRRRGNGAYEAPALPRADDRLQPPDPPPAAPPPPSADYDGSQAPSAPISAPDVAPPIDANPQDELGEPVAEPSRPNGGHKGNGASHQTGSQPDHLTARVARDVGDLDARIGPRPDVGTPTDEPELRKNAPLRGPNWVSHGTVPRSVTRGTARISEYIPAYRREIKVLDAEELMTAQLPHRDLIMSPWLTEKGLAMVFAPRGVGKTWLGLGIAHAIGSGDWFLKWKGVAPRKVLYIDGEMPTSLLKERYAKIVAASGKDAPKENFRLAAADYQQDGLPDLSDPEDQKYYDPIIADADLIILDNYSILARIAKENEADSFGPIQSWLLAQRAAGRSVSPSTMPAKGGDSEEPRRRKMRSTLLSR